MSEVATPNQAEREFETGTDESFESTNATGTATHNENQRVTYANIKRTYDVYQDLDIQAARQAQVEQTRLNQIASKQQRGIHGRGVAQHQDRHRHPCRAQRQRFRQPRHRQGLRPCAQRRAGHRQRAMSVTVGLDHRHQGAARVEQGAQGRDVTRDGRQVHLGPGQGLRGGARMTGLHALHSRPDRAR